MTQVLGIIPARGGSKGIPQKNTRVLAGKPLLGYSIEAARRSGVIDRLILSTDSKEIADLGESLGLEVPFMRPASLAQDDTPMLPVLRHAIEQLKTQGWQADIVVLLQPTAPLRQGEHIAEAVKILEEMKCDSVVSVVEIPAHYSPHYVMKISDGRLENFLPEGRHIYRRQDIEPAYSRDGSVYVFWRKLLMEKHTIYGEDCRPLIMDSSVNLDTLDDWAEAEKLLLEGQR